MSSRLQPSACRFEQLPAVVRPGWLIEPDIEVRPAFVVPAVALPAEPPPSEAELAAQAMREAQARAEAEGRAHGEAEGRARLEQAAAGVEALLKDLESAGERLVLSLEDRIVDLALSVASTILERELEGDREHLLQVVRQAVALVADGDRIEIRVSPADLALLGDEAAAAAAQPGAGRVSLRPDPAVSAGCIVESRLARVDATLAGRLRNVGERLHNLERS